jgi:hypothetical protein
MQPYHPGDLEILSMGVPKTKGAVRLRPIAWASGAAKRSKGAFDRSCPCP